MMKIFLQQMSDSQCAEFATKYKLLVDLYEGEMENFKEAKGESISNKNVFFLWNLGVVQKFINSQCVSDCKRFFTSF